MYYCSKDMEDGLGGREFEVRNPAPSAVQFLFVYTRAPLGTSLVLHLHYWCQCQSMRQKKK